MNILVINLDKAIFSEDSASLARLKEYSRLVDKIFVIVWTKGKFAPIIFENRLLVFPTNSFSRWFYFLDSWKLARKIIRQNKIDLVFTQDPFETGSMGWLIAKINRLKLQLQIHTDVFSPYFWRQSLANKFRVFLARLLVKRADGLRVVSQRIKKSLVKLGISEKKIFVLPIFTDLEKFTIKNFKINLKEKYPQFEKIILMASRFSREKNVGLAIVAMLEVIKTQPAIGLIIVGEGPEKPGLKAKIKAYGLERNIIIEPWTENLSAYYQQADLFVLTSNYEGWGMSVVEALASGCGVVMTDVGCAGELVENLVSGLIVPVGDKEALHQAIRQILNNQKLSQELKANGLATVKKLASKEEYLDNYKVSWEEALK